jgi:hypothetical protein
LSSLGDGALWFWLEFWFGIGSCARISISFRIFAFGVRSCLWGRFLLRRLLLTQFLWRTFFSFLV